MGKTNEHPMGFLRRLAGNQSGNTMAIVAAAIIPLAGLIGGGLDMSRAYMVRTRMQQACDAAALAGRRSMTGATMSDADKAEAKKFFDFNFPQNTFGSSTFVPVIRSNPSETTTVEVSAVTTVPTTLMRIFGYETLDIAVDCNSRFDIGNTDVMLVLDTTGSMVQNQISDGKGGSVTRLAALQQAVKDFYDTLGPGSDTTGRIRYGFMPYSSTVNVGYSLPASALVGGTNGDTWNYQTRRRVQQGYDNSTSATAWSKVSGSYSSSSTGQETSWYGCPSVPAGSGTTSTNEVVQSSSTDANGVITTVVVVTRTRNGKVYTATSDCYYSNSRYRLDWESANYSNYQDKRTETRTQTPKFAWQYGQYALDVSQYIKGSAVPNPAYDASDNKEGLSATTTWKGCIEERSTDSTITKNSSVSSVPATAFDLQVSTEPTNTATRWRPHWPEVEFTRSNSSSGSWLNTSDRVSGGYMACPNRARKLSSYANRTSTPAGQTSSFNSYVDGLTAVGGTYHTIGMIWGARFLSANGIFSADNGTAPNGFNISRHIVFMTDGDMTAYDDVYGAWGYQLLDQRDGPSGSSDDNLTDIHNTRLQMMCNAIKAEGIKIWVIGFRNKSEGDIKTPLQNCASGPNYWMMAYDGATLTQKFRDIAKNIGGLRVSK